MIRKIIFSLAIFIILLGLFYVGMSFFNLWGTEESNNPVVNTPTYNFAAPTPAPISKRTQPATKLKQTGWIPDWAFNQGFATLQRNKDLFDSISPVWYHLGKDGKLTTNRVGLATLQSFSKSNNIKLIPSIANFNSDEFSYILRDPQRLDNHINFLLSEVDQFDYDGLDLDYESIYLDDQPEFLYLVRKLYDALDAKGKTLTIAVMPIWTDSDIYRYLRQTRQVQDWQELGLYVHELRIMTYNVTSNSSKYPGPIAPLDWMEANLRYARHKIEPAKLMLGLNQYSYGGWGDNLNVPSPYLLFGNPGAGSVQASALVYQDIVTRRSNSVSDRLDPNSLEKVLRYVRQGKQYIAYYQDRESAKYRYDLALKYGIKGMAHWRMGGEDESVYSLIN